MASEDGEGKARLPAEADPHFGRRGTRRDREFRRYAEAAITGGIRPDDGSDAVSSRDISLTAYAQLVTLRLGAKRALISLYDKDNQYIIAEATQTLSLQEDETHALGDRIWFGATVLERQRDFQRMTLKVGKKVMEDGRLPLRRYLEVRDLTQDKRFAQHRFVVNEPNARSYGGVPMMTPDGYAIGTISFLDDKVRDASIKDEEVIFLQDIATTVMAHLERSRMAIIATRGLKLAKGLSRFVEGKAGIEDATDATIRDMTDRQATQTAELGASRRTHAINAASNAERVDDARETRPFFSEARQSTASSADETILHHWKRNIPGDVVETRNSQGATVLESASTISATADSVSTHKNISHLSNLPVHISGNVPEELMSKDIIHSFQRAAKIITASMAVSGTIFLDASVNEWGRLHSRNDGSSSQESDVSGLSNDTSSQSSKREDERPKGKDASPKICRLLASAYNTLPPVDGSWDVLHRGISERFLKSVMRRYPYGKVWTFDNSGRTSSSDFSDSSSAAADLTGGETEQTPAASSNAFRKRPRSVEDGATFAKLFTGVKSLCLMPIYDSRRERFFAGAIAWSYNPIRVLTVQEDLTYLGAFCDVVMAEVERLDAQTEAQAKTSFISSISHELRSPLHGILGSVECLRDEDNASIREEMLQMIESSGKSLLDIINHLLEHAHAVSSERLSSTNNKVMWNRQGSRSHSTTRYDTSSQNQRLSDLALLTEEVLDTALWPTPKPSPLSDPNGLPSIERMEQDSPIKVILDVNSTNIGDEGWWFYVNSGAWRRVVQNLIANSVKYTDPGGYLKVSLSVHPSREGKGGKCTKIVELVVADSGRGISENYLKYHLWSSFSQENAHSQGTGLGLSLVHGILKEMGGKIEVQSTKGIGTAVRARVPLKQTQGYRLPLDQQASITDTEERLKSRTYALLGFGDGNHNDPRTAQANSLFRDSIAAACTLNGLRAAGDDTKADVFIIPEVEAMALCRRGPTNDLERAACNGLTLVVCHSMTSSRALPSLRAGGFTNAIPVSQPLGPRKLLRALVSWLLKPAAAPESREEVKEPLHVETNTPSSPSALSSPSPTSPSPSPAIAAHPSRPRLASRSLSSAGPSTAKLKTGLMTLLVDDNDLNLRILCNVMERNGHDYKLATNGLQAVDSYKNDYDTATAPATIICMDITMPVMDGLEATRQIRHYERSKGVLPSTIIALTALASPEARQEAFSSGCDFYLTKPLKFKELTEIVGRHVKERDAMKGAEQ